MDKGEGEAASRWSLSPTVVDTEHFAAQGDMHVECKAATPCTPGSSQTAQQTAQLLVAACTPTHGGQKSGATPHHSQIRSSDCGGSAATHPTRLLVLNHASNKGGGLLTMGAQDAALDSEARSSSSSSGVPCQGPALS